MTDDHISFEDFLDAVAQLEALPKLTHISIEMNPSVLRMLRTWFSEHEISDICAGKGPGWDLYIEMMSERG